jgi:hypothetical protein
MRHLSAIFVVIFLVLLPSCKYFKSEGLFGRKKAAADLILRAKLDSIRVADSLSKVQESEMALENEKLAAARKADEERLVSDSRYRYNIIVGSFISPEYAKGLAEDYRNRGYDSRIIIRVGDRFELVSAEAHESITKAVARLKEFQDTVELNAWIYIKE